MLRLRRSGNERLDAETQRRRGNAEKTFKVFSLRSLRTQRLSVEGFKLGLTHEPRNPWQENWNDADVPAGRAGGAGDAAQGRSVHGGAAQDAHYGWLRFGAARAARVRQAAAH